MEHRSVPVSAGNPKSKSIIALASLAIAIAMAALLCLAAPADALASQDLSLTTAATKTLKVGKAKSLKVKAGAEKMTITFKKGKYGTKSQIAYKKAGAKKWTYKAVGKKTNVKINKLTGNTKYYVKVRSYKKVGKKTIRGAWSAPKSVKPTINSKLIGNWELYSAEVTDSEAASSQAELLDAMGISFTPEALAAGNKVADAQNAEGTLSTEELLAAAGIDLSSYFGNGELSPLQQAIVDNLMKEIEAAASSQKLSPTLMGFIKAGGGNLKLTVKSNEKAQLVATGTTDNPYVKLSKTKWNFTWEKKTKTTGALKLKGYSKSIPAKFSGDKLTIEVEGTIIVFVKVNAS